MREGYPSPENQFSPKQIENFDGNSDKSPEDELSDHNEGELEVEFLG